jgi:hypothetical protein
MSPFEIVHEHSGGEDVSLRRKTVSRFKDGKGVTPSPNVNRITAKVEV